MNNITKAEGKLSRATQELEKATIHLHQARMLLIGLRHLDWAEYGSLNSEEIEFYKVNHPKIHQFEGKIKDADNKIIEVINGIREI